MDRKQLYISTVVAILVGAALAKVFSVLGFGNGISTVIIGLIIVLALLFRKSKNINTEVELNKKLLPTLELLEEGKINQFIKVNELTLEEVSNPSIKLKIILFIIVGYEKKKDYNTPRKLLEEIDIKYLTKEDKVIHQATLCVMSFKSNHIKEAYEILENNKAEFSRYRGTFKEPGIMVTYVDIIVLENKGKYKEAIEVIKKARQTLGNDAFKDEYENIIKKL